MKITLSAVLVLVVLASGAAWADVKPHALFSSNAVLQQGQPVPVWGTTGEGEKVTVDFAGQTLTTTAKEGRWRVTLQPLKASTKPQTMTLTGENRVALTNLLVGEVWVASGQSNMGFVLRNDATATTAMAAADDPQLRLFTVPQNTSDLPLPQQELKASWQVCTPETAARFSAVAYYFGRDLRQANKVPVGLINTSWGGTPAEAWTPHPVLEADPLLKKIIENWNKRVKAYDPAKNAARYEAAVANHKKAMAKAKEEGKPVPKPPRAVVNPASDPHRPACLYNAMIAPIQPVAIKGAIWYQGESNNERAKEYQTLFPSMIKSWRDTWGQGEFPFLFVQIAPHQNMLPEIREAQLIVWQKTPGTAMAVITDIGDATDIHPKQKEPVGARLALAARALAYNETLEFSGPVYSSLKIQGHQAVLQFTHTGRGLVAKGGALKGFTVAGADHQFVPAVASIKGETVVVTSPAVANPVAVRYGWVNVPDVNLYNEEGLPATPFRTDVK